MKLTYHRPGILIGNIISLREGCFGECCKLVMHVNCARRHLAPGGVSDKEARRRLLAGAEREVRQTGIHSLPRPQAALLHRQHHGALQLPRYDLASGLFEIHFDLVTFLLPDAVGWRGRQLLWRRGCLCVCHVDVLCQNGQVDHHAVFAEL